MMFGALRVKVPMKPIMYSFLLAKLLKMLFESLRVPAGFQYVFTYSSRNYTILVLNFK